jgi:energy-coupling factor transporter ATP-binding protein EcfA2
MPSPLFDRLTIAGWRQFSTVDIKFHPRLTVITGANGAGKSTLLNLLSTHLGTTRPYLAVPTKRSGTIEFLTGLFNQRRRLFNWLVRQKDEPQSIVGELEYTNGTLARITVPRAAGLTYNPSIEGRQPVLGFHMPSHRLIPNYQEIGSLDFTGVPPSQAFNRLINENYAYYVGNHTGSSVLTQLKYILASWAALGAGNEYLDSNPEMLSAFKGFIEILTRVLPKDLRFIDLKVQPPNILLETASGTFLMDASSGGILTIIELAALIYTCSLRPEIDGGPFVVTFDEPENHLHPELQRSLFPTLINTFPNVQFIVATHSPFMVSSMRDSNVYVLKFAEQSEPESDWINASNRVESIRLDYVNRAGSAGEILRQVLGVPVTHPQWVESELDRLTKKYSREALNEETLAALRADIDSAGLGDFYSDALVKLSNPA